ncbi:NADH-quinone oxidoreductase subunit C [Sediminibacterium sp.]|uniref:NADH-quinone oxidoreductase subunit C n=1 Tax=Sediminibacterium sp. TaxID=1917865 RepID=UPI002727B0D7|nr:NADH-quinone oxidoreductase subunit C [Sediminibacterium sp.]MDO9000596.1 NADH-quinone oxidoreductase subunit C [Bacteroidota bacterium]MDP3146836.1 NADH-quinone oxidoreductase subunit C [Bacteroidota bacterium]MDP3567618.1 NADH-quinone oxidoreductase subunit C [Sediminibacterium sp.]
MNEDLFKKVNERLNEKFPDAIEVAEIPFDFPSFTIKKENIHEVLVYLKNDEDLNFHFLTDLTGFQTEDEKQLAVIYHLHNMQKNYRVRIKTYFDINKPEIPTATDIWPGANWMERETFDFYGVRFKGHPNLKRILNVDEMDIFPMRKEYPLEDQSRDDKSDKMFGR